MSLVPSLVPMRKLASLEAWRVARQVARGTYQLTLKEPLRRHFALADQLRRAALSIPANVAEGYALGTRSQLVRCLRIALGSSTELACHVEMVHDLQLAPDAVADLRAQCDRLIGLLIGLLKRLGAKVPS